MTAYVEFYFFDECVIEDAKAEGVKHGFRIDNIVYSGFWSQGDGASWKGAVDLAVYIAQMVKSDHPNFTALLVMQNLIQDGCMTRNASIYAANSRYCHEGIMRIDYYDEAGGLGDFEDDESTISRGMFAGMTLGVAFTLTCPVIDAFLDEVLEAAKDYARGVHRALEEAYYYQEKEAQETAEHA